MNKKVVLSIVALLVLFATIVSASSHGTYDGHNIVKLKANGKELVVEDVPAINYKGRTMVPIGMLRQTGLDVVWNGDEYSVDVIVPKIDSSNRDIVSKVKELKNELDSSGILGKVSVQYDHVGMILYIEYIMPRDSTDEGYTEDIMYLSYYATAFRDYPIDGVVINVFDVFDKLGELYIPQKTILEYFDGVINQDKFIESWTTNYYYDETTDASQDFNYYEPYYVPYTETSVIESKISSDFEGFDYENLYELDNGQIWKQTSFDYKYSYKYRPDVIIYKDGFQWKMSVEGINDTITVEQIK